MLGHLGSPISKKIAEKELTSSNIDLSYNSTIVLGWTGNDEDLELLNEQMNNLCNPSIRGYSVTAMRQIWCRLPDTKSKLRILLKNL